MSNLDNSSVRTGLAHLTGLFNEIERRLADTESKRGKIQNQQHDKINELEKALELEIERRITAEKRLAELVDTQLRLAMERMSGAFEAEMNRLNRRMEVEILSRFETIERDINLYNNRVSRVENTISALAMGEKKNAELLQKIEEKLDAMRYSDEKVHFREEAQEMLNNIRSQMNDENITNYESIVRLLRGEIGELESRFAGFEQWFRDNITPELVDLKSGIENEVRAREASTTEVVTILSKYARLMQKQFGGEV